tara:strand:+ start:615 stop:800 length:186 start_codon:yes stop_codon:yes gene_type:complete
MDKKITTVKVLTDIYNDFKRLNIESGFSLQKLVNRSMYLYVNEDDFKGKIENTQLSGSISF